MIDNDTKAVPTLQIKITQAESKQTLALLAHFRRIFETCIYDSRVLTPIDMDQADLLLAAGSFRALLFDHECKILLEFLNRHQIDACVDAYDSNLNLFLLSWLVPDDHHVSDFLAQLILDKEMQERFPEGVLKQFFVAFSDGKGFEILKERREFFRLTEQEQEHTFGGGIGISNLGGPTQLISLTRRRVSLADWGNLRIGYLKSIPITRKNLLCFVANRLGGVHYDSTRSPPDPDDKRQYEALTSIYDWKQQAIMHAGLVGVALACIEFVKVPEFMELAIALDRFHHLRQERLMKGKALEGG